MANMNRTGQTSREVLNLDSDDELIEIDQAIYESALTKKQPYRSSMSTRSKVSPVPTPSQVMTQGTSQTRSRGSPCPDQNPDRSLPQRAKILGRTSPRRRTYSPATPVIPPQRNASISTPNGTHHTKRSKSERNDDRLLERRNKRRCTECMATGLECDGERPCSRCCEPGFDCRYPSDDDNTLPSNVILSGGPKLEKIESAEPVNHWARPADSIARTKKSYSIDELRGHPVSDAWLTVPPYLSTSNSPSIGDGDDNGSETRPTSFSILMIPQTFNDIKDLIEDHKRNLDLHREYLVQADLTRSKLAGQKSCRTSHPTLMKNPWRRPEHPTESSPIKTRPQALELTLQVKVYRGNSSKRFTQLTFPASPLREDPSVPILPKYKSIGRLGPSFLSRNVHTLKFMPYYPDDECPSDPQETANKETELKDAYKDNDGAFLEQRRCLETVFQWSGQFSNILGALHLDAKKLTTWLKQSAVGKCGKCGLRFANSDVASEFTALFDKLPHAHALRCMRLNQALTDVINVGIWHFLETKPGSFQSTFRSANHSQRTAPQSHGVCSICSVYGCLSHGSYIEGDDNDDVTGLINDPEDEYNNRQMIILSTSKKLTEHACGIFCLPHLFDRALDPGQILGVNEAGDFTGQKNDQCVLITDKAPFQTKISCSEQCFLHHSIRKIHLPVIQKIDLAQHPTVKSRVTTLVRMFHKHIRLPCIIAKALKYKVDCSDAFEMVLNVHHLYPHPLPPIPIEDLQGGRKTSQLVAGYDVSQSRYVEKRRPFVPCSHDGPCLSTSDCPCAHDRVHCEQTCGCTGECKRRFKGCRCKGPCFNDDRCECWRNNRECDPWLCGSCGVVEVLDPSNKYREEIRQGRCHNNRIQLGLPARTIKARSEIQGWGLYAGENLEPFSFVGEYRGEIIQNDEASRRGVVYHYNALEYLFKINNTQEIDGSNFGNKTRFMNNSQRDENINVQAKTLLCNGIQRVMFYTKRAVKAGEELLYNYNYPEWVSKAFWEKGEEQVGSNGLVKPLAKPIISGRFTRTTIGKADGDQGAVRKVNEEFAGSRKRKRLPEDEADGFEGDGVMDKAIGKLSVDAQANTVQEIDPSDDSDYCDAQEHSTSEGSQVSDEALSEASSEAEDEEEEEAQPRIYPEPSRRTRDEGAVYRRKLG